MDRTELETESAAQGSADSNAPAPAIMPVLAETNPSGEACKSESAPGEIREPADIAPTGWSRTSAAAPAATDTSSGIH